MDHRYKESYPSAFFTEESYTLDGLMYEINYYSNRGYKPKGEIIREGGKYIQIMKNPSPGIPY